MSPEDQNQPMTAEPLTVAFHIGVHKTATSHLQQSLNKATDALAAQGVRYYGPEYLRLPGRTLPALFGFRKGKDAGDAKRAPAEQLALLRKDGHRLLLSEENFIGWLNSPKGSTVKSRYINAGDKITELAAAIGQDIDVFMAVRRPSAFINSAYCQMLMGGRVMPVAVYQRRNPLSSVNWLDLVSRVRAAKGVGQLTVWKYEDYNAIFGQIVEGLAGTGLGQHVDPVSRAIHMGLSSAAVAEVLHRTEQGPIDKIGLMARKLLPIEEGYPRFDGFGPDEHAMGDAAYAAQLKGISALEGVTVLLPEPE